MSEYEKLILKLTNEARGRQLAEIEAGILRNEGRVAEIQTENERLKKALNQIIEDINIARADYAFFTATQTLDDEKAPITIDATGTKITIRDKCPPINDSKSALLPRT